MKYLVALAILVVSIQTSDTSFYLERVEILSKYDATYIHWLGNKVVPPDRLIGEQDIQCLVSEITATGIFKEVKTSLHPGGPNSKRLLVSVISPQEIESKVISEVTLGGLPEADEVKFMQALGRRGIKSGLPFLQFRYRELYDRILEALYEVYPNRSLKDAREDPWVTIRPSGPGQLKLIVSPAYSGCNSREK